MDLEEFFPLSVSAEEHGQRLDSFLSSRFAEISRSRWTKVISQGKITIDGKVAESSDRLKEGQEIALLTSAVKIPGTQVSAGKRSSKLAIEFRGRNPEVVFEDDDILVVNKPEGLGVHPGSGMPLEETLVAWALANNKLSEDIRSGLITLQDEALEEQRPGIVHRLDKGTSGAIVLAKNKHAHEKLAQQFASREAGRCYFAVVKKGISGLTEKRPRALDQLLIKHPCPVAFRADAQGVFSFASYLLRDPVTRVKFKVAPQVQGKKAITHFCEVSSTSDWSLVECKLETGRTHQIRVHLAFLECPILGDDLYGGVSHSRMMLHAHRLRLRHPRSNDVLSFDVPWSASDQKWLESQGLKAEPQIENRLKGI